MMQKKLECLMAWGMNRKLHEKNTKFPYPDIQQISGPSTSYKYIISQ